jgi:excinuclease ABC subunit A
LRDLGNTLIVVEHDEDTMRAADRLVDFGPGPGVQGGELISTGSLEEIASNPESLTGGFLGRRLRVRSPQSRRKGTGEHISVRGAAHHNLKGIDVKFPLGMLVAVTGVSGSGKSSLVTDILSPALRNALNGAEETPGKHEVIQGLEHLDKIIDIDQSPIGRTPRSNPATYTKLFDEIRDLFAELPESKRRGFAPGTFSFNTELGRCTACEGHGANRLDMEFLPDLWVPCAVCEGRRYNRATLQVLFKGKSIADCLDLDVQQAI